jgi:hypothetical protein
MNGKYLQRAALLAAFLTAHPAMAAVAVSVSAIGDTYVRSGAEKKNFDSEPQLELKTTLLGGTTEGYLLFPIPQHTPFAEKIVLRVFAQLEEPGSGKMLVRTVSDTSWHEEDLTWRTRPAHKDTVGTITLTGISGAWYELDVTAYCHAQSQQGKRALGFALVPADDSRNALLIQSRESRSRPPVLAFSRNLVSARISFCPSTKTPPDDCLADNGLAFGSRENGFTYGWNVDSSEFVRDRAESKYKKDKPQKGTDRRYDFLIYMDNEKMKSPIFWEMAVPNGAYNVHVVAGDSTKYDSIYGITVEDVAAVDGIPDSQHRWIEGTAKVIVTDGRLTIAGTKSSSNNKLCFIEVVETEDLLTQTK